MKRKTKKLISIFLCGAFIQTFAILPISVEAETLKNTSELRNLEKENNNKKYSPEGEEINIPDENLRESINKELKIKNPNRELNSKITKQDMLNLTHINGGDNITSLEGLQYATNLEYLNIELNPVSDLSPIETLNNLKELVISSTKVKDLNPISKLYKLESITCSGNNIEDISPLANLVNLKKLRADNNKIKDLSTLSNLTNLYFIDMFDNKITDISPLANNIKLSYLELQSNSITDINPLKNLKNLRDLTLSSNHHIKDMTSIKELTEIRTLYLEDCGIEDISFLANLKKISYLNLNINKINDISALSNLSTLSTLNMDYNNIRDISPLENLSISSLSAKYQYISLPSINVSEDKLELLNPIKDKDGSFLKPVGISDNGTYADNKIVWKNLRNSVPRTISFDNSKGFSGTVQVNFKYTKKPEIKAEDKELKRGDSFKELENVTASDKEDGDLTSKIKVVENTVDTTKVGEYKVVYEVTDSDRNTVTKEIKVTVKSNEKPEIKAEDKEIKVGDNFNELEDVTAEDKEDGDLTSKIKVTENTIDTTKVGEYKVVYEVIDADNNTVTKEIKVTVRSNEKPEIKAEDKELKVGDTFNELENVIAEDKEDGDLTSKIKVTENTVDTTKVGEYKIVYEVIDADNNTVTKEIKVTVRSNEKPEVKAEDKEIKVGDSFKELEDVTASDKEDGDVTSKIKVTENTVNTTKVGEYKVVYEVTDSDNNKVTKEVKVTVMRNKNLDENEMENKYSEPKVTENKENNKKFDEKQFLKKLPQTGGISTRVYVIIGVIIILVGVLLLSKGKKNS